MSVEKNELLVLHGPNLNLLGQREPSIYGRMTLTDINAALQQCAAAHHVALQIVQSNHEGGLIDVLHEADSWAAGALLNAGAYTHTSIALHDAISGVKFPVVEIHLSNIYARAPYRHYSCIASVCIGQISGFGWRSYILGLTALLDYLKDNTADKVGT